MGKENDIMLSYLEDNGRFADLFNIAYFEGKQIVNPKELEEASEVYTAKPDEKEGQRIRDLKKRLKLGKELKILAVEVQNEINYIMPWRIMDYDCREYGRQITRIRRVNRTIAGRDAINAYSNAGERLCEFRKEDRLTPVYTLCLYHDTEEWNGPRSLKDIMNFGEELSDPERQEWEKYFSNYPMRLLCVNEVMDCSGFRTSLKEVFSLLPYRRDKVKLKILLQENPVYQKMDAETAKTVSVLLGVKKYMENKEKYKVKGGYNMCQAIQEMMDDSKMEGEDFFAFLAEKLIRDSRTSDLLKAVNDKKFRQALFMEYGIQK